MSYKIILLFLFFPIIVFSSPLEIKSYPQYNESLNLVKKLGRQEAIKLIVELQREQMSEYGSSLDEYTNTVSIIGSGYGMTQNIQVKSAKLLGAINKQLLNERMTPLTERNINSFIKKGGAHYNKQVMMLCTNPSTRGLIDSDIEYIYKYFDDNMKFISEIAVTKSVCTESDKH